MKLFKDDKIEHKENDIEKIQTKPNMYIGYLGKKGTLHLSKEIINNAIDECINNNSPGNEINIYLDENENTIKVKDNGRGIPFESMELSCTKLQAGSKYTREGTGASAGENGVGMTAVNALSSLFEIIVTRYGERAKISFKDGKKIKELEIKKIDKKEEHGTTVIFKPNPFFMGSNCTIPSVELIDWLEKISYLIPSNIKITLNINKLGKESNIQKKFKNKNGLYDYVTNMCKKQIINPIHFLKSMKIREVIPDIKTDKNTGKKIPFNREITRFLGIEVAFSFNSSGNEFISDSFCNFVHTVENGVHVDAVKQGIMQFLSRKTKESLSEKESKNLDITFADISNGLVLAVYLSTDMNPQLASQTKEKVSNNDMFKPIRDMTFKALNEYFNDNQKDLKKIIDYIKANAKARLEANKIKNSVIRGETSTIDEHLIKDFTPANNIGNKYRELYIIEGKSAKGSAEDARDPDTQAIFPIMGVPLNTFGLRIDKLLLNERFRELLHVLKCNIGERFSINKLYYDKIIIMTDADIDGHRITSLLCTFFLVHLPEIIKQGKLYKAVSPLYKIKDKKKPFVITKKEFIEVFENRISDAIKIIDLDNNSVLNSEKVQDLLLINRSYYDTLYRLASHFSINPILLEYIILTYEDSNFSKKLVKKFPEINIDSENIVSGVFDNKFQIIHINKSFEKKIEEMKYLIKKINKNKIYYKINENVNGQIVERGEMSLGQFFMFIKKFQPEITTRYKGLGELDPEELWDTTMNPNKRVLIRLSMEDVEAEVEKFRILHGDSAEERKNLMKHFKIDRDDIDN